MRLEGGGEKKRERSGRSPLQASEQVWTVLLLLVHSLTLKQAASGATNGAHTSDRVLQGCTDRSSLLELRRVIVEVLRFGKL